MDSKWIGMLGPGPSSIVYWYPLGDDEKVWHCYHVTNQLETLGHNAAPSLPVTPFIWFNKGCACYRANSS